MELQTLLGEPRKSGFFIESEEPFVISERIG